MQVGLGDHDFEARHDGHGNAHLAALLHEREVVAVVEEHLRDDVVGPGIHLVLQVEDVPRHVGGVLVFLRVATRTDAKVRRRGVDKFLQEVAVVHLYNLGDQIGGVLVLRTVLALRFGEAVVIAAHGQHVLDAEVV